MKTARLSRVALAVVVLLLVAVSAWAETITVLNPSFEEPVLTSGSGIYVTPTSWSKGGECGMWYVGQAGSPGAVMPSAANGTQALWSNGGYLYQVLGATLQSNTLYTLTIDAGKREISFGSPVTVSLGYGSTYGANTLTPCAPSFVIPASLTWTHWTVKFQTGANPAGLGQALRVDLNMNSSQPMLDNIALTAEPVANTDTLTIMNPSFEDPVSTDSYTKPANGWTWVSGDGGTVNKSTMGAIYSAIADGNQAIWANGGACYQVLTATLKPSMVYTLKGRVCARTDVGFGSADIKLGTGGTYGTNTLTATTTDCSVPATGTSSIWTVTYVTGEHPTGMNEQIRIDINLTGSQPYCDSVELTAAPVSNMGALTILNPSFESPAGVASLGTKPTSWTMSAGGDSGMVNTNMGSQYRMIQDGAQAIWANDGFAYQVLAATVHPNTFYTLTVSALARTDVGFGTAAAIKLGYGSTYGTNYLIPSSIDCRVPNVGTLSDWTMTFKTDGSTARPGEFLRVDLNLSGVQPLFDNVRLTAGPLPLETYDINILNAGFEDPVAVSSPNTKPTGWTWRSGDGGVANKSDAIFSAIPEGNQAVWANEGSCYQVLSTTLRRNKRYILTAYALARTDYPFGTTASIGLGYGSTYGSNLLEVTSAVCPVPAQGVATRWVMRFASGTNEAGLGEPLRVDLNLNGYQPYLDDLHLEMERPKGTLIGIW